MKIRWDTLIHSKIVKLVIFSLSPLLGGWILYTNWDHLALATHWQTYLSLLGRALLIYPCSLAAQAYAWVLITSLLSPSPHASIGEEIQLYLYTYLMKRIPGSLWYIGGRAALYKARDDQPSIAVIGSGIESILLSLAAALIVIGGILVLKSHWSAPFSLLLILGIIIATSRFLARLHTIPWFNGKRYPLFPPESNHWEIALIIALYIFAYGIGAKILQWIILALGGNISYLPILLAWALAGGIGNLISTIIPTGGGVRDLSLGTLLLSHLPLQDALLVVVLWRIILLAGDSLWSLAGWFLTHKWQALQESE